MTANPPPPATPAEPNEAFAAWWHKMPPGAVAPTHYSIAMEAFLSGWGAAVAAGRGAAGQDKSS